MPSIYILVRKVALAAMFLWAGSIQSYAEEGCPKGQLRSEITEKCTSVSQYNDLPLDASKPMKFEAIQLSMATIYGQATGTITKDTPAEFKRFIESSDGSMVNTIYFHSPGGSLMAGLELGELIRKSKRNTGIGRSINLEGGMNVYHYKDAFCASACAYAFLGGVSRSFGENDKYGLHRFGSSDKTITSDDAQVVSSIIARYVERMGANQTVLQAAASASFEGDIFWVPVSLAAKMKVIFEAYGQTKFRVEDLNGETVVVFEIAIREKEYKGYIFCAKVPVLVMIDKSGGVFKALAAAKNFPATLIAGNGKELNATVTYDTNPDALLFTIPGLSVTSFNGEGLTLSHIRNPILQAQQRPIEDGATPALVQLLRWSDAVGRASFTIAPDNAAATLPIVLRSCSR